MTTETKDTQCDDCGRQARVEKDGDDGRDDGDACRTGDERHYDSGDDPIILVVNDARAHHTGDAASVTGKYRHKGFTRQAQPLHNTIYNKGPSGQVADVFQNTIDEKEHNQDTKHEHENLLAAEQDAIHDDATDPPRRTG